MRPWPPDASAAVEGPQRRRAPFAQNQSSRQEPGERHGPDAVARLRPMPGQIEAPEGSAIAKPPRARLPR